MPILTHFLPHKSVNCMCNTGWGLYRQGSISFSSVCVDFIMSQFVLKSISTQQDSPPNTRHSLVVLLVISNHVITPINFQNPLLKHVLFADTIFGKTARHSYASCRKYESMSNCLAQAAVTPDKNLTSKSNDRIRWYSYMCNIFHALGCYRVCCFSSQSSPEKRLDGGRANGRWSSRLFELSSHSSTKPDNIPRLFKHYSLTRVCHHLSAHSFLPWAQKEVRGTLLNFFNCLYIKWIQDGNLLLLFTSGGLLMHLLIEGNSPCLTMDKVAAMKSDTLLHLEDSRRAEERSRLNCVDLPQSSLTDGQSTDLLRCQDSTEDSSAIKYRRYGYALFVCVEILFWWHDHQLNRWLYFIFQ